MHKATNRGERQFSRAMLRTNLSSLSSEKITDSENVHVNINDDRKMMRGEEMSPNRRKYEKRFLDRKQNKPKRTPLAEKTNTMEIATLQQTNKDVKVSESMEKSKNAASLAKEDGESVTLDDLFFLPPSVNNSANNHSNPPYSNGGGSSQSASSHPSSSSSFSQLSGFSQPHSKIEELTLALSDTLKENEELYETVKLLKAEIQRLQGELEEQQEYAELYMLSKELIESQSAEIASLKANQKL